MRLHCIIDNKSKTYQAIPLSLEKLKEQYDGVLPLVWDFEYKDLINLNWIEYGYGKDNYGVDTNWLLKDTSRITKEAYDCIIYFIDKSNWTTKGNAILGWNLGQFYNNFQIQLVQVKEYPRDVELTLKMEIAHSLDNFIFAELGVNLSQFFNVPDYDEDIIHGRMNPPYAVFEYRLAIEKMSDLLTKTFEKRLIRHQISLLNLLIALLRQLIIRLLSKPSPVFEEELEYATKGLNL